MDRQTCMRRQSMAKRGLVTGAGGFSGHHLVKFLVGNGFRVRGVDIKPPEYEASPAHEFEILDLRRLDNCLMATAGVDEIYPLAAALGGIGYTPALHAQLARNDTMMNVHLTDWARAHGAEALPFSP